MLEGIVWVHCSMGSSVFLQWAVVERQEEDPRDEGGLTGVAPPGRSSGLNGLSTIAQTFLTPRAPPAFLKCPHCSFAFRIIPRDDARVCSLPFCLFSFFLLALPANVICDRPRHTQCCIVVSVLKLAHQLPSYRPTGYLQLSHDVQLRAIYGAHPCHQGATLTTATSLSIVST